MLLYNSKNTINGKKNQALVIWYFFLWFLHFWGRIRESKKNGYKRIRNTDAYHAALGDVNDRYPPGFRANRYNLNGFSLSLQD